MPLDIKAYELFWEIYNANSEFKKVVTEGLTTGKVRFFNDEEWNKIRNQNFVSPIPDMKEFIDMFLLGYNKGNCVGASRQLSYSYDDVDIVSGILPILKGTLNAFEEGGHCWLETDKTIIDTSLMLVIDKSLKDTIGYIEEERLTASKLKSSPIYQARKEFVNDVNLRGHRGK